MFIWQVIFYQGYFYSLNPSPPALFPSIHQIQHSIMEVCWLLHTSNNSGCSFCKLLKDVSNGVTAPPASGWQGDVRRQVLNLLPFTSRHCWGKCQSKVCFALYLQICFVIKRLKVLRSWSLAMWHPKASASTMFLHLFTRQEARFLKVFCLQWKATFS